MPVTFDDDDGDVDFDLLAAVDRVVAQHEAKKQVRIAVQTVEDRFLVRRFHLLVARCMIQHCRSGTPVAAGGRQLARPGFTSARRARRRSSSSSSTATAATAATSGGTGVAAASRPHAAAQALCTFANGAIAAAGTTSWTASAVWRWHRRAQQCSTAIRGRAACMACCAGAALPAAACGSIACCVAAFRADAAACRRCRSDQPYDSLQWTRLRRMQTSCSISGCVFNNAYSSAPALLSWREMQFAWCLAGAPLYAAAGQQPALQPHRPPQQEPAPQREAQARQPVAPDQFDVDTLRQEIQQLDERQAPRDEVCVHAAQLLQKQVLCHPPARLSLANGANANQTCCRVAQKEGTIALLRSKNERYERQLGSGSGGIIMSQPQPPHAAAVQQVTQSRWQDVDRLCKTIAWCNTSSKSV